MSNIYLTEIQVSKTRNLENLIIPIASEEKKHLIITGKNGTGKTTLLEAINTFLTKLFSNELSNYENIEKNKTNLQKLIALQEKQGNSDPVEIARAKTRLQQLDEQITRWGGVKLIFNDNHKVITDTNSGKYILAYFDAKRHVQLNMPTGIQKVQFNKRYSTLQRANTHFIQYIVNLKADRSFAKDDGEMDDVVKIDNWFDNFENSLREIMDNPRLSLKFDRQNYNFKIIEKDKLPYDFNTLSDGYSAIISIVTELILRMEVHNTKSYDLSGIVLIDEVETHLHVELQKKILPFLTKFFPKIQFIITTHSPFILSSIPDAIICDLQTKMVTKDLTGYSYDAIIESYFGTDKYSREVKLNLTQYELLLKKNELTQQEKEILLGLEDYFSHIPKHLSNELIAKIQQIKLNSLNKSNQ